MNNASRLTGIVVCVLFLAVSCRQLYTESMGTSLARDNPSVSSSASVEDLLDIARSRDGSDQQVAKEILDVLADQDKEDIDALSLEEKADLLNLGGAATIDLDTLAELSQEFTNDPDNQNELIQDAINQASDDVDTTVLEQILSDDEVLTQAPPESVVGAATAIVASVSAEVGVETVSDILTDPTLLGSSGLTQNQQDQLSIVIHAADVLETREDVEDITVGDFDLLDLLRGNV